MGHIHIMKDKDADVWYAKQDGAQRKSFTGAKTQAEAIEKATEIAKNQSLEVAIHRADNNQIREKNSYGNDPYPPKG